MSGKTENLGDATRKDFSATGSPAHGRRSFLGALLALGSFCVGALLSVPLIRFTLFPLLRRTTDLEPSAVGPLSDFSSLTEPVVRTIQVEEIDGWRKSVSEKTVYVTKDTQGQLCVLSSICPHLGCTVPWTEAFVPRMAAASAGRLFAEWIALKLSTKMANFWCASSISVSSLLIKKS
jgi:Rieske Fe-S protein